MRHLLVLCLFTLLVQQSVAPPVKEKKPEKEEKPEEDHEPDDTEQLEYHRYLKEVVEVLESDPEFRKKLHEAKEDDVKSGRIAHELEYANHHVRTKLDEIKRQEIERLRHLATKEYELENGLDIDHMKIPEHLDHENPHSFEIDDLKKLIAQTTKDLDEVDKKRRAAFKQYEMEKKFEQEQKLKGNELDEEARKKYEEEIHQMEEKHKKHEPLHHPGSKQQLEEVWEKQDHMESQDFDPKTFFYLHDLDGNGAWDQNEVKALFRKELDKLYAEGHPEDDLLERAEEMERMREHVFKEADLNKDGLISFHEFLQQTKRPDFQKDDGWETLDEQQIYSKQEYEEFERRRLEELQRLVANGIFPQQHGQVPPHPQVPHPNQQVPYHGQPVPQQQPPQQYQQHNQVQGQVPVQQQYQYQVPQQQIPPQVNQPQGQYQQYPPQGQVPQQYPPQGQVPQQYPPQGQVPQQYPPQGQAPQQYQPQGQVPQQYPSQGQAPQQYQQGQAPQQYQPQGQAPQQYQPQGQAPQQYQPQGQAPQQYQPQGQAPQQNPPQGQVPQQNPPQGQAPQQIPPQGQAPQQIPPQGQVVQQIPPQGQVPQQTPPQGQAPQQNPPVNVPAPNSIPPAANKV